MCVLAEEGKNTGTSSSLPYANMMKQAIVTAKLFQQCVSAALRAAGASKGRGGEARSHGSGSKREVNLCGEICQSSLNESEDTDKRGRCSKCVHRGGLGSGAELYHQRELI